MFAPWLMPVIAARNSFKRAGSAYSVSNMPGPPPLTSFCGWPVRKRLAQGSPERIQAMVGHLEDAADVGRLLLVEKEAGLRRVRVLIAGACEKAERDERVEEVAGPSRDAVASRLVIDVERLRTAGQLRKQAELDGAQQDLGRPERETGLKNPLGIGLIAVHDLDASRWNYLIVIAFCLASRSK